MNPNREEALFALALEKLAEKRPAFLDAVCEVDTALRARLEALLDNAPDEAVWFEATPPWIHRLSVDVFRMDRAPWTAEAQLRFGFTVADRGGTSNDSHAATKPSRAYGTQSKSHLLSPDDLGMHRPPPRPPREIVASKMELALT